MLGRNYWISFKYPTWVYLKNVDFFKCFLRRYFIFTKLLFVDYRTFFLSFLTQKLLTGIILEEKKKSLECILHILYDFTSNMHI